MSIKQIQYDDSPLTLAPQTALQNALSTMLTTHVDHELNAPGGSGSQTHYRRKSYVLITQNSQLTGILTERDFVRLSFQNINWQTTQVQSVMTQNLQTIVPDDLKNPIALLNRFRQSHIRHLPIVTSDGELMGVITHEHIRQSLHSSDLLRLKKVSEIMAEQVLTEGPSTPVSAIAELMSLNRKSCIVICNASPETAPEPIGIVTERDIIQALKQHESLAGLVASDIMSSPLILLDPSYSLWDAHQMMQSYGIRRMVVAQNNQLKGIVTQSSILYSLDLTEIHHTINLLNHEVERLKNEKVEFLQNQAKQLESEAASAEQRFQAIFDQAFQMIGLLAPNGTLIEANQTALEAGGLQREEVVGLKFWDAPWWQISPQTQRDLQAAIAQAAQGNFIRYEVDVLGTQQRVISIDFSLRPIFDDQGQVSFIIPEGRDISDRKQAEQALQKQRNFERLMCQTSTHLINVSGHKLNQTLQDILEELGHFFQVETSFLFQFTENRTAFSMSHEWIAAPFPPQQLQAQSIPIHQFPWSLGQLTNQDVITVDNIDRLPPAASIDAHNWSKFGIQSLMIAPIYIQAELRAWIGFAFFSKVREWSDTEQRRLKMISEVFANTLERVNTDQALERYQENLEELVAQRTQALQESEERFQLAIAGTEDGIFDWNLKDNTVYFAPRFKEILGYQDQEFPNQVNQWKSHIDPADRNRVWETFQNHLDTQHPFNVEYRINTRDGQIRWIHSLGTAIWDQNNIATRFVGSIRDISHRKQVEMALFREKELAQVTLLSIGDAVITTDAAGRIEYFNAVAEMITGWRHETVTGQPIQSIFQLVHESSGDPIANPICEALRLGKIVKLGPQAELISKNGSRYSIEYSAAPIRSSQKEILGAVMVFRDVTDTRQLAKTLSWQASHDSLTQLINRREFEHQLQETLQKIEVEDHQHVLCFLDLDRFKVVNDTCGHVAGDALLRQIAQLLQSHIRTSDTLARLGGDEFGILLRDCDLAAACRIAETIRTAIEQHRFSWTNQIFSVGITIGLVQIKPDNPGIEEILNAADAACYVAKESGRNQIHVYQVNDHQLAQQREERQWSLKIQTALENDELGLYVQNILPTRSLHSSSSFQAEILVQMHDPQGNVVAPGTFLPAAERYDLMPTMDRWVIHRCFQNIAHLHQRNQFPADDPRWMINLSSASLKDSQFLDYIQEEFKQCQISPTWIGFEITETAAIANLDHAQHFIRVLQEMGCCFALDHFGRGISSFGYLKSLPVNYLKIDGQFISNITEDAAARAMVEAMNHVAHAMNIQTIAEWVETQEQQAVLTDIGVDWVQGFGIHVPQLFQDGSSIESESKAGSEAGASLA